MAGMRRLLDPRLVSVSEMLSAEFYGVMRPLPPDVRRSTAGSDTVRFEESCATHASSSIPLHNKVHMVPFIANGDISSRVIHQVVRHGAPLIVGGRQDLRCCVPNPSTILDRQRCRKGEKGL